MSDYWDEGEHVRRAQQRLRSKGYDIGYQGVDGKLGENTERALRQERADEAQASASRASSYRPSFGGSSSSSVDGGTILSWLIAAGLVIVAIYWFVTVVLPVLIAIAAGFFVLKYGFIALRASIRRYGAASTFRALGLAIGIPSAIAGYVMAFTGD